MTTGGGHDCSWAARGQRDARGGGRAWICEGSKRESR